MAGLVLAYQVHGAVAQSSPSAGYTASEALPAVPSVKIVRGTLISPTAAASWYATQPQTVTDGLCTTYASNTEICAGGVRPRPPEIKELARALRGDPNLIYEYVRNSIDTEFLFGLHKGGLGALIDQSGTAFDQSQLMVELLREAGFTARYRFGTLTLTATEVTAWTGLSDAKAVCDFLATGGIPATASTCTAGSATAGVTVSHVWVEADIGGSARFFDPAYKTYEHKAGINVRAAMGFVSGEVASAAGGPASTTGTTGLTQLGQRTRSAMDGKLATYSQTLLTALKTSTHQGKGIDDIVGGRVIIPTTRPTGGWLQATPSNYAASASWTGGVPDPYRAQVTLSSIIPANGATPARTYVNATFFADEIYGRTAELRSLPVGDPATAEYWAPTLILDGVNLAVGESQLGAVNLRLTLQMIANHPFAADSGAYGDAAVNKVIDTFYPAELVISWGSTSSALLAKWTGERAADSAGLVSIIAPLSEDNPSPSGSGDYLRARIAGTWLAQYSLAADLHGELANARPVLLHTFGTVSGDHQLVRIPENPAHPGTEIADDEAGFVSYDEVTVVDFESSFGMVSRISSASARRGAVHALAATAAALEGSVIAQIVDSPDAASTAARFAWGNNPESGETPNTAARPFYRFETPAAAAGAFDIITYDGGTTGVAAWNKAPAISVNMVDLFRGNLSKAIQSYTTAGFEVVASGEASLGPGHRIGSEYAAQVVSTHIPGSSDCSGAAGNWGVRSCYSRLVGDTLEVGCSNLELGGNATCNAFGGDIRTSTIYDRLPTLQRGGAFVATRYEPSDPNEPVEIANVLTRYGKPTKGGGGPAVTQAATFKPGEAAQALKDRFIDRSAALGVDLGSGRAGFASPVLASVGPGEFPYRLDKRIELMGGGMRAYPEYTSSQAAFSAISEGPVSNWRVSAEVGNSGFEAMGQSRVEAAVPTIVSFVAMQDIWATLPKGAQREVSGTLVADWWARKLLFNVVTIFQGASAQQFLKLTDNSFVPANGGAAKLEVSGDRELVRPTFGAQRRTRNAHQEDMTIRGYRYKNLVIALTGSNGDKQTFEYWKKDENPPAGEIYIDALKGFRLKTWTFPQGVTLTPQYDTVGLGVGGVLPSRIVSSLGYTLELGGATTGDAEAANTATAVTNLEAVDLLGAKTKLVYRAPTGRTISQRPDPFYRPLEVYAATDQAVPSLSYSYDGLGRVKEARDAVAIREPAKRGAHQFFVAEGYRGERQDPLGGRYAVETLRGGRETRNYDELYFTAAARPPVVTLMDGRGRVTERTFPEGDKVRFTYDAKDNPASLTKCPKTGCGTALDMTVSALWHADWNKPTQITDALGRVTTFSYWESGDGKSLLKTAVRPAPDGGASQPTYSFWYTAVGLLWKATDADGYLTENGYNSTGCLTSARLGPSGLGLTRSFACDAVGNTTEAWDARGESLTKVTTTYDLMRRPTEVSAPLGAATKTTYDLEGRPTQVEKRLDQAGTVTWQTWKTGYTATGQTAWSLDPSNDVATFEYDGLDRKVKATAPTGDISAWVYDAAGQLLQVKEGVGIACGGGVACEQVRETYAYTPNGQKASLTDARGNTTQFVYDVHDRLLRTVFPDGSWEGSSTNSGTYDSGLFDLAGNVLKFRTREGAFLVRTYDALDRPLTEKGLWTDGTTPGSTGRSWRMRDAAFAYWPSGRMISASTDQVTKAWIYDTAGRPLSHTASTPAPNAASYTFTYGWDVAGNLTSVAYPTTTGTPNPGALTATYAYDALGRMTGVTTAGIKVASATLTYDTLSRRKGVTFGDGSAQAYDYEADDDLSSIAHTFTTAPTTHNVTLTYGNDRLGRQVSETTSNTAYLYDPPLAATGAYGAATALNQYPTVGATSYSYTPNDAALLPSGSVTNDGVRAFFYDEKGNLTKARQGTDAANNFDQDYFDALGVRWFSYRSVPAATDTSRIELTDGLRPEVVFELHSTVAEGSSTPVVAGAYYSVPGPNPDERLIWINGTEATLKARYPHTNRRGDTIALSKDGAAEVKFKYGPFGESADSTAGYPWRFTGQRLNGWTGLYHFKARAYAPAIGRFLQPDPIGYEDGPNLYAYVQNDPYNATDPLGLETGRAAYGLLCPCKPLDPDYEAYLEERYPEHKLWKEGFAGVVSLPAWELGLGWLGRGAKVGESVWGLGWALRGLTIETRLGGNLPKAFPVIDRVFGGLATSIKSINLRAESYKNASRLAGRLDRYIASLAKFKNATFNGTPVREGIEYTSKELLIAIPEGSMTSAQREVFAAATKRAAAQDIKLTVTEVR